MTDRDLIQALECCGIHTDDKNCGECPVCVKEEICCTDLLQAAAARLLTLQSENGSKDKEIERLEMQVKVKDACISGKSSIIARVEAERDAAVDLIGKLERCLNIASAAREGINPMVEHATDVAMAAIAEWRGAQGVE